MSSETPVIRIDRVSKVFHIYERPADRLKQMLMPRVSAIAPVKAAQRWGGGRYSREFWALRDVSVEVGRGEALGILGRNGSGKSTLLQLIAGTLAPTSGSVEVRGRIAALLELGSGFNPDFTGRENVIMNGMILGLTEKEILDRFDDIAAFADIGEFIDQPLRAYSSGMMLRLAFAVQTQIDPDIMIVDEALAVGDALFQKRCFQRLEKLRANGCTLLLVSHDQETVRTFTDRALLLRDGVARAYGPAAEVVLEYRRQLHEDESSFYAKLADEGKADVRVPMVDLPLERDAGSVEAAVAAIATDCDHLSFGGMECAISQVKVFNEQGDECAYFHAGDPIRIRVWLKAFKDLSHLNVNLRLRNKEGVKMYSWGTLNQDIVAWWGEGKSAPAFWDLSFRAGDMFHVDFEFICTLGMNFYEVQAAVTQELDRYYGDQRILHWRDEAAFFQVGMRSREYPFGGVMDLRMKATAGFGVADVGSF